MRNWIAFGSKMICGALLLAVAGPVFAQSSWGDEPRDSDWGSSREGRQQQRRSYDDRSVRGYDYVGPYAQLGVTIGVIDFDGSPNIDVEAGGGVSITGGFRFLSWLSGEANFTYVGGGDAEIGNTEIGEAEFFAFTFGPKFFPFAAIQQDVIPEFVQPYALVAIGGGEFEIDARNRFGGDVEESTFIARFIFGTDFWITDHIGAYVEGGYHAAADDDIDGAGVFTFGGQYRF